VVPFVTQVLKGGSGFEICKVVVSVLDEQPRQQNRGDPPNVFASARTSVLAFGSFRLHTKTFLILLSCCSSDWALSFADANNIHKVLIPGPDRPL